MSVEDGEIRERGICDESVLYDDDVIAITFQGCQSIDLRTVCTFVAIVGWFAPFLPGDREGP